VQLKQPYPTSERAIKTADFEIVDYRQSPKTPLRIIKGKSHSGDEMGIMNSVQENDQTESQETLKAILDCIKVKTKADYDKLYKQFERETKEV